MPEKPYNIVITEPYADAAVTRLQTTGHVTTLPDCDRETILTAVPEAHALLIRTRTSLTREIIDAAPRLMVIARAGVGIDNIDLDAARERNIPVVHTPAASTQAVAELTIALTLMLLRHVRYGMDMLRANKFEIARAIIVGQEIAGLTTGIIGMGRIGSTVGRIVAAGFGGRVIYNDIKPVGPFHFPAESMSLHELLQQADIVTLHVPLDDSTRHMINETTLNEMKSTAVLINTARGPVVSATALNKALGLRRIAGAALDVFENEPLTEDDPLFRAPNLIATPHIASRTENAVNSMNNVVEDVIAVLNNQPPKYPAFEFPKKVE